MACATQTLLFHRRLTHLCNELAVDCNAGAAVVVEAVAVAALLVGVQVHAAGLGRPVPDQVQSLVQLPQLQVPRQPVSRQNFSHRPIPEHIPQPKHQEKPSCSRVRYTSALITWWWLPLPLVMISTPDSASAMCGAAGVNSSSHVSAASTASFSCSAASPRGHVRCPVTRRTSAGRPCSSTSRGRFQLLKYLDSLLDTHSWLGERRNYLPKAEVLKCWGLSKTCSSHRPPWPA